MGGSESKTTVESITKNITDVSMDTVQSCEIVASQSQKLNVNNTGLKLWGNYKLEQKTDISQECFNDVRKQTELQNKIMKVIAQATSSNNIAVLGAFGKSKSEATTKLNNTINNTIKMSNIQRTYNEIKQNQEATFNNSGVVLFEKVELTQGAKIFAAATLKQLDNAGVFNTIAEYVDQKSSAKMENPLDFIAKVIGSIGTSIAWSMFLFVFLIIGLLFGLVLLGKAFGGIGGVSNTLSTAPGVPPQMRAAAKVASTFSNANNTQKLISQG